MNIQAINMALSEKEKKYHYLDKDKAYIFCVHKNSLRKSDIEPKIDIQN